MTIGRDPACQIRIDAPGVSRRHAMIRTDDAGTPVLEDLGSTNGTFVGGRRVRKPVVLEDGQSIRVGEATLIVRTASPADAPTKKIKRPREAGRG
jgi:pSer/pThr/pTyr-binding forkhead associated (FHA) protein